MVKTFPEDDTRFSATKVTVFVPSTKAKSRKLTQREFSRRITNTVGFLTKGEKRKRGFKGFGGTTRFMGTGTFVSSSGKTKGKVIQERVGVVEAFVPFDKFSTPMRKSFSESMSRKAKDWGQESLAVSIESPRKKAEEIHFIQGVE